MATEVLEKYYKHYEEEYAKIIGLPQLKELAKSNKNNWLLEACDNFNFPNSSIWRHENMANVKYMLTPRKSSQITTVFKIIRSDGDRSVIYAIMYSHINDNAKIKQKFIHDFVALSPTYKSADGEYRHRFVPIQQIINHRKKYSDLYDSIEKFIAKQVKNNLATFQTYVYGTTIKDRKKEFNQEINLTRFVLTFYIAEWCIEFNRYIRNRSENHIVDGYHAAMFGDKDIEIWNKHKDFLEDEEKSHNFYTQLYKLEPTPGQPNLTTEAGQKLIPLTVRDVELSDDLRLDPWREMYITSHVGDLVINGRVSGLPILGDWFFISENDKMMYDNKISLAKLNHSEISSDIIRRLEEARRGTYVLDPIKKSEIYISYKMEGFSSAIDIPMEYAEKEIVLAPYVLCAIEEHLGRTFADVPMLMMFESYRLQAGPVFKDIKWFSKYMLECVNILKNLNDIGVIHGDPHMNNGTFYEGVSVIDPFTKKSHVKNPHVIYQIWSPSEKRPVEYIFPCFGRVATLIDFSRGFIWDKEILAKDGYNQSQIDALQSNYKKRMVDTMRRVFPDYTESHIDDINLALERHFDLVYRVFQATDTYRVMAGWEMIIQTKILDEPKHLKTFGDQKMLAEEAIPLINRIKLAAHNFFTKYMDLIISRIRSEPPEIPQPNTLFIDEFFKEYRVDNFVNDPANPITLIDYFSDQNPFKYNIRHYDNFPPTIKFDYILKHKVPTDQIRMASYLASKKYLDKHDPAKEVQEIASAMNDSRVERRGTPTTTNNKEDVAQANKLKLQIASSDDIYYAT